MLLLPIFITIMGTNIEKLDTNWVLHIESNSENVNLKAEVIKQIPKIPISSILYARRNSTGVSVFLKNGSEKFSFLTELLNDSTQHLQVKEEKKYQLNLPYGERLTNSNGTVPMTLQEFKKMQRINKGSADSRKELKTEKRMISL